MAKKEKSSTNKTQDKEQADVRKEETIQDLDAEKSTTRTAEDNLHADEQSGETVEDSNQDENELVQYGQVIDPIAYAIKLREIHPHESYGRCGYRFYKNKETEIPAENLTPEQILTLAEDPWLELIPVCEE